MRQQYLISLVLVLFALRSNSQQKFIIDRATGKPVQTVKYQKLTFDNGICGYLHRLLPQSNGLLDNIVIDSCIFQENPKTVSGVGHKVHEGIVPETEISKPYAIKQVWV